MKKLLLSLFVLLGFAFSSCGDVCSECKYILNGVEIPQERCGTKSEVDDFEKEVEEAAKAAGAQVGETPEVVCTKK